MVLYNVSNITGSVNFAEQAQGLNLLADGLFGTLFLLSAMAVVFLVLKAKTDTDDFVLVNFSLWFGTILAVMLRTIDLVPGSVIVLLVVSSFVSIAFLLAVKR